MRFPECTTSVSPGVGTIVVSLATSVCFWDGTCRPPAVPGGRGCVDTTDIVAVAPDNFVAISVANTSTGITYGGHAESGLCASC